MAANGTSKPTPKDKFPSLFKGLGKLEDKYMIEVCDDVKPFSFPTPGRVAIPLLMSMRHELEMIEKDGEPAD